MSKGRGAPSEGKCGAAVVLTQVTNQDIFTKAYKLECKYVRAR